MSEASARAKIIQEKIQAEQNDLLDQIQLPSEEPDWIISPKGECLDVSDRACELTERGRREHLMHGWRDLVHRDDVETDSYVDTVRRGRVWTAEYRVLHGSGIWQRYRGVTRPLRDERGRALGSEGWMLPLPPPIDEHPKLRIMESLYPADRQDP